MLWFALSGAILGPLVAVALLFLSVELEEWSTEGDIQARLAAVIAAPEDFVLHAPPGMRGIMVLSSVPVQRLPAPLLQLPDGTHEYETSEQAWLVALGTTPQRRYAVVEDISVLENRERYGFIIAGIGTLLAVYAALAVGFYLSRRLLAPILRLSQRVSEASSDEKAESFAEGYAQDEVGALAAALDRYQYRTSEALRREREFSSDASHELRNPLTVIRHAAEIIEEDPDLSPGSRRAVSRIAHSAEHMSDAVNALLLMVRERPDPRHEELIAVADVVEQVLEQNDNSGQCQAIAPQWRRDASPQVRGARVAVEIIVTNLVRNALQHSLASAIHVVLTEDRLTVSDDGIGVSEADLRLLTQRGHRGVNARGQGAGLGLSIVTRMCERFGWRLVITSRPNRGTQAEWIFGTGVA